LIERPTQKTDKGVNVAGRALLAANRALRENQGFDGPVAMLQKRDVGQ
jgi:hypothetical protein